MFSFTEKKIESTKLAVVGGQLHMLSIEYYMNE